MAQLTSLQQQRPPLAQQDRYSSLEMEYIQRRSELLHPLSKRHHIPSSQLSTNSRTLMLSGFVLAVCYSGTGSVPVGCHSGREVL